MHNKELSISFKMSFVQRLRESVTEERDGTGSHIALITKKSYRPDLSLVDAHEMKTVGSDLR